MRINVSIILLLLCLAGCESATRSGFDEKKTLVIFGRVADSETNRGLADAEVRFFSISDPSSTSIFTDKDGNYSMETFEVYCVDFVSTPDEIDPFFVPHDRYFLWATKAGYDTVRYGAFGANIHCFDIDQRVNFRLRHLNHPSTE